MAQANRICHGVQNPRVIPNFSKSNEHKSPFSVSMKTQQQLLTYSGLKNKWSMIRPVRVMASISTADKHSKASEIVLQPIKEISGLVKLPGSKSLSNRILLLAALSEDVMLIWGEQDQVFPLKMAHDLKEMLGKKVTLKVIKKASHIPFVM